MNTELHLKIYIQFRKATIPNALKAHTQENKKKDSDIFRYSLHRRNIKVIPSTIQHLHNIQPDEARKKPVGTTTVEI